MQRTLFDLKERKFELNIYLNPVARESYSRYLARQFPTHDGMPIQSVRWHLGTQGILPPAEAVAKHKLHDDSAHVQLLNEFQVGPDVANVSLSTPEPLRELSNETAMANVTSLLTIEAVQ